MRLDVVLPCLDEAAALPTVLRDQPPGVRAIVVDNGSCDGSADVARCLGATVVDEPVRGYGAACHRGLLEASAELVAFCDADASLALVDVVRVARLVATGAADLALGRRVPVGGAWPWHAAAANRLLAVPISLAARHPLHDLGAIRVGRRRDLLELDLRDRRSGYPLETGAARRPHRLARARARRPVPPSHRPLEGHGHRARHGRRCSRHGPCAARGRVDAVSDLTLLVLAKEPVPGRVKTRLSPALDPDEAARVAEAALADTLHVVAASPARRRVLVLDGRPGSWLPAGIEVRPQAPGGLADRLEAAFALVDGPAFLVGMDTPQLRACDLDPGLDAAGPYDAALGLSPDGGFWGVGLRSPTSGAFRGVPMSTPSTGALQRARLEAAGLVVRDLAVRQDVDTVADARQVAALAPGTRFAAALARTGVGGVRPVVELYDAGVRGERSLRLLTSDGRTHALDLARWSCPADATDLALLERCEGVTLDVGCGPGRMAAALAAQGRPVLGVDVAGSAVDRTAAAGALALRRSVFDPLPGEGRWDTVLLADGNLGIGADPLALLQRVRALLRPGGLLLIEPERTDVDDRVELRLASADGAVVSESFGWARVGARAATQQACALGYRLEDRWSRGGRTFLALRAVGSHARAAALPATTATTPPSTSTRLRG